MLISRILAWIAAISAIFLAIKFVARILATKNRKFAPVNRWFHNIHIPFGIVMVIASTAHGILAGNFADTALAEIEFAPVLFTWNAGTLAWILTLLLGLSYLLRKKLKKNWMTAHRALTAAVIIALIFHLTTTGIGIHTLLFPSSDSTPSGQASLSTVSESTEATSAEEEASEVSPADKNSAADENSAADKNSAADENSSESETASENETASSGNQQPAEDAQKPEPESSLPAEVTAQFAGETLRDGTYTGSAEGYHGSVTVEVTVEGGTVTQISVTEQNENQRYFERALAVIDAMLSNQTWEVDAVSGATYSSNAIKQAVENALSGAIV